jgi:putative FmdB family regulatory protein
MPTYEYVCKACGHLFEIVRSMNDEPLTECPECGGELRKVFAAPSISFRGSGFYATDHRKKSREGATEGAKEPATSSDSRSGKGSGEGSSGEKGTGSEKKSESAGSSGSKSSGDSSASGGSSDSKGSGGSDGSGSGRPAPKEGASS